MIGASAAGPAEAGTPEDRANPKLGVGKDGIACE
jgi:hypothetical protein